MNANVHTSRASAPGGRHLLLIGGALAVAAAVFGIVRLFQLRFEAGDVYPPYSSLRSDPLGTKAYFEAMGQMDGVTVERGITPLARVSPESMAGATFFVLGARGSLFEMATADPGPLGFPIMIESDAVRLEAMAAAGARVVFTLDASSLGIFSNPEFRRLFEKRAATRERSSGKKIPEEDAAAAAEGEGGGTPAVDEAADEAGDNAAEEAPAEPAQGDQDDASEEDDSEPAHLRSTFLPERWGFELRFAPESEQVGDDGRWPVVPRGSLGEEGIDPPPWYSPIRFVDLTDEWEVLAESGGAAVVMRRPFGEGELVIASDTFFVSNEALWKEPATRFLLWLSGGNGELVFDETHHAIVGDPGIMGLVRRYRLAGFFLGTMVFLALYAWRNGSSLVPADESSEARLHEGEVVIGNDASTGLNRLLARNVPAPELLSTCYRIWYRGSPAARLLTRERADRIIALIEDEEARPPRRRRIVEVYNRIAREINERR